MFPEDMTGMDIQSRRLCDDAVAVAGRILKTGARLTMIVVPAMSRRSPEDGEPGGLDEGRRHG